MDTKQACEITRGRKISSAILWLCMTIGAVFFLAAIAQSEYRLRSFINYPWLDERDSVIERIEKLEDLAEKEADQ